MNCRCALASVVMLLAAAGLRAQPLTTAFTYQGELRNSGSPVSGLYDLRFRLYDAPTGGTQLGSTLCADNVPLSNGRFTISLDFGAQFAGQQRFLEIDVRQDAGLDCSNAAGFTLLSPRQPLTAAPNAAFALNAAAAASAGNASQLNGQAASFYQNASNISAGTIPDARLAGTYTGALTLSNASNSFSGSGSGLVNLNASSLTTGTLSPARIPIPLSLTGADPQAIVAGQNSSTSPFAAGLRGTSSATTGGTYGVYGETADASGQGAGIRGVATAAAGSSVGGLFSAAASPSGTGVQADGQAYGGFFISDSPTGVGAAGRNPYTGVAVGGFGLQGRAAGGAGTGVFGLGEATTGANFGVQGMSNGASGTGVFGRATASAGTTYGVVGQSDSTAGTGAKGVVSAATGATFGLWGESFSTSGIGVYGLADATTGSTVGGRFDANSPSGVALIGMNFATSGTAYALEALTSSSAGTAVYGEAGSTSGTTYGGSFTSASPAGTGVKGAATALTGVTSGVWGIANSTSGRGVYGQATATSGQTYGVLGQANANGWAVFATGDMGASGLKPFRIDHPADPANKYLLHYATESPEVLNFYRGTVTLDGAGQATVDLPEYFARINRSPSYQLTAIGAPMPLLHVAAEIDEADLVAGAAAGPSEAVPMCTFRIAGGAPGGKVSWRVEAVRNDRWVQAHGAPVEIAKEGAERGTYQHPDLYGQPPDKGLGAPSDPRPVPPPIQSAVNPEVHP